jgi:hypothetical protein
MRAHLILSCDNAAFGETREEAATEVAYILDLIARKLRMDASYGSTYQTLRDSNGNDVGSFCLKGEGDPGYADLLPKDDRRR